MRLPATTKGLGAPRRPRCPLCRPNVGKRKWLPYRAACPAWWLWLSLSHEKYSIRASALGPSFSAPCCITVRPQENDFTSLDLSSAPINGAKSNASLTGPWLGAMNNVWHIVRVQCTSYSVIIIRPSQTTAAQDTAAQPRAFLTVLEEEATQGAAWDPGPRGELWEPLTGLHTGP